MLKNIRVIISIPDMGIIEYIILIDILRDGDICVIAEFTKYIPPYIMVIIKIIITEVSCNNLR